MSKIITHETNNEREKRNELSVYILLIVDFHDSHDIRHNNRCTNNTKRNFYIITVFFKLQLLVFLVEAKNEF